LLIAHGLQAYSETIRNPRFNPLGVMIKKIVKDVKKILRLEYSDVAMEGQASVWETGKTLRNKSAQMEK
jgi:hypothetical protein